MEKKHGKASCIEDSLGKTAENKLAKPAVAKSAHDQETGAALDRLPEHGVRNCKLLRNDAAPFHAQTMPA